jgi:hypothetical protein
MKTLILPFLLTPFIALASGGHSHHHHHKMHHHKADMEEKTTSTNLEILSKESNVIKLKINEKSSNKALTKKDFIVSHTEPVHIFLISEDLEEYLHTHPAEKNGIYEIETNDFNSSKNFRIWADLIPKKTNSQEYSFADYKVEGKSFNKIKQKESFMHKVGDFKFILKFQHKLKAGKNIDFEIIVKKHDKPFEKLEKIMGALSHVVGFLNNNQTIIHIHPISEKATNGIGGEVLKFNTTFENSGFVKMFAQFKIEGKEYIIPFGFKIE